MDLKSTSPQYPYQIFYNVPQFPFFSPSLFNLTCAFLQCSPKILATQVRDHSWPKRQTKCARGALSWGQWGEGHGPALTGKFRSQLSEESFPYFKTYIKQISHCYLLLLQVNFTGYGLIRRILFIIPLCTHQYYSYQYLPNLVNILLISCQSFYILYVAFFREQVFPLKNSIKANYCTQCEIF